MPFALAFVAIPLALNPAVQAELPRTVSTRLFKWAGEHPELKIETASAAAALAPVIKESIGVAASASLVSPLGDRLIANEASLARIVGKLGGLQQHAKHAVFLGRWLARSGTTSEIFMLFGVKP